MSQNTETMNIPHKESDEDNFDEIKDMSDSTNGSCSTDVSTESIINSPVASQQVDYKKMTILELKEALLTSKLEMLEAQEAVRQAKENIKLNEEEYLKRRK